MGAYERCGDAGLVAFVRGDANADSCGDISDSIYTIRYLFGQGSSPSCLDAADTNDDGEVDIADAIALLAYLFAGGSEPGHPHRACGVDVTPDALTCVEYAPCRLP